MHVLVINIHTQLHNQFSCAEVHYNLHIQNKDNFITFKIGFKKQKNTIIEK